MRWEAVIATRSPYGPEQCLTGVSAALAEARRLFRRAAPELSWTDVTARADAVRAQEPMTLMQALSVVYNRIYDGRWIAPRSAELLGQDPRKSLSGDPANALA